MKFGTLLCVLILLVAGAVPASAASQPRTLKLACASAAGGVDNVLHFLGGPSRCTGRGKRLVDFSARQPVYVCRAGRQLRMARGRTCGPGMNAPALPGPAAAYFCARHRNHGLRWVGGPRSCTSSEFVLVLAGRRAVPGDVKPSPAPPEAVPPADGPEPSGAGPTANPNHSPVIAGVEPTKLLVDSGPIVAPATNRLSETITLSDADGGDQITHATVRITDGLDVAHHDVLELSSSPAAIASSYDDAAGVLRLSGAATREAYESALRSIAFTTDTAAPSADRTVTFQVDDGHDENSASNVATRSVRVANVGPAIQASPGLTPAFSQPTSDYVVRCTTGTPVTVSVDAPPGTDVSVDLQPPATGTFDAQVSVSPGQGFEIAVSRSGQTSNHYVRCLPADFPSYTATVSGAPQAQWYLITPSLGSGATGDYAAIFNNDGVPVWWKSYGTAPVDFKLLANGNLVWFSHLSSNPSGQYNELTLGGAFVQAGNTVGTPTDLHEYKERANGNHYLVTYPFRDHLDVSAFTGKPEDADAAVLDAEVQEIAPNGSVVWAWNSATHIGLAETGRWWTQAPAKTADNRNVYDVVHINSVEDDGDGIVVSLRHADAVYRIDKATGGLSWKLGGTPRAESLTIVGDPAGAAGGDFGGQHDARILPDGTLTLHDNGTGLGRAPRALRFSLDTGAARTATLIESVSDPAAPGSACCGSARRLPLGDWVMSWGSTGIVTELAPDGALRFRLDFGPSVFSYRAQPLLPGALSDTALRAGMDEQYPR